MTAWDTTNLMDQNSVQLLAQVAACIDNLPFNFTHLGEEFIRDSSYISQMNHQQALPNILTAQQKEIVAVIRERLQSLHNVDTSSLDDNGNDSAHSHSCGNNEQQEIG